MTAVRSYKHILYTSRISVKEIINESLDRKEYSTYPNLQSDSLWFEQLILNINFEVNVALFSMYSSLTFRAWIV